MFTEERKQQMISSLEKDYVILSDVFSETVADVEADMGFTGELILGEAQQLINLKLEYIKNMDNNPQKAVEIIEAVYILRDKYDAARKVMDNFELA